MLNRLRPSILIVDSDSDWRRSLVHALEEAGFVGAESATFDDASGRLDSFAYDGLIVDVRLAGGDGLDLLDHARERYPLMPCLVTTAFGSIHHAVRVLKRGALDYLLKPVPTKVMVEKLTAALSARDFAAPAAAEPITTALPATFGGIIGRSAAMQPLFQVLERVSPMQSTVLIQGETGTGKELIARNIHDNSTRRDHAFVAFNAAAIPDGLAEAELFGHVKGAFTGATYQRVGRFEAADRGTLFIDEVSSMSLGLQAKLLRALQEREIERVGTSRPMKINVRVIAATNVDLMDMVRDGRFREDLLYRLNVVRVQLPPLRLRREDIPELAGHFLRASCKLNDVESKVISQATLQTLMQYNWPGNVRQLQNAVETAVVMSGTAREIQPDALPPEVFSPLVIASDSPVTDVAAPAFIPQMPETGINFVSAMSQVERELILTYLRKTGGNKRQTARLLQLSRTTLIDKLNRLGVTDYASASDSVSAVA